MQELTKAEYDTLVNDANEVQDHIALTVNTPVEARQITIIKAEHNHTTHYLIEIRAIEESACIDEALEEFYIANHKNQYESLYLDAYYTELSSFVMEQMQQTGLES